MSAEQIHILLERLCNLLRVEARSLGAADGLSPVHLETLHYLVRCNRYSDTVQAVTEFLGQTKGTVSQTLKVLENRGLLQRRPDGKDRRVVHLGVTAAGAELVNRLVPAESLKDALGANPEIDRAILEAGLKDLLRGAQLANGARTFAACRTCRYNEVFEGATRCGLTGESLSPADTEKICREHEYPAGSPDPNAPFPSKTASSG